MSTQHTPGPNRRLYCSYCSQRAVESIFWKSKQPRRGTSGYRTVTVGIHACEEHRTCVNFTTSPGYGAAKTTGAAA